MGTSLSGTIRINGRIDGALDVSADNALEWDEMALATDASYVNTGATVTFALKDSLGASVSGGTGSLSYVAASNGKYQGTIESSAVTLSAGSRYYVEITASTSGGANGFRRVPCVAANRGAF